MFDVPLTDMPAESLLAHVSADSAKLLTPTRFLGSRFVMTAVTGVLPTPLHRWFARTVYGPRFLRAIVSNMPGPPVELSITGIPLERVLPILPLAPGAPLALGAPSWTGELGMGLATDPKFLNASALAAAMHEALRELPPHNSREADMGIPLRRALRLDSDPVKQKLPGYEKLLAGDVAAQQNQGDGEPAPASRHDGPEHDEIDEGR